MRRNIIGFLVGTISFGAMASAETDLAAAFGAREQIQKISMSPDGTRLAYVVPTKGQGSALLTFAPGVDQQPKVALMSDGETDRLSGCHWITNSRLICDIWGLTRTPDSALYGIIAFSRIVAVDMDGGNLKMLSKSSGFDGRGDNTNGGRVIDWLADEDGAVLMTRMQLAEDRIGSRLGSSEAGMVVDKVDTRTLATSRVERPEQYLTGYLTDGYGHIRVKGVELFENGRNSGLIRYFFRAADSKKWESFSTYNYMDQTGFLPVAVDHERNAVYGFDKTEGRRALYRMALDGSGSRELLLARPDVDVDDLVQIGRRNRVIGASYATDARYSVYFDEKIAKLRDSLAKALPGQPMVSIVDSSIDEKKLLIRADSDKDPGVYYILDRATKQMATFQPVRPQLEGLKLAEMRPVSFPAADGTMIPGYLTLPPGSRGKNLPAIVMPHGGPEARDEWGFDWMVQYYAARGYAVLQPNFRGSTGYGDDWFQKNGYQSWPTAIGDVTDAGRWLIKQGIAAPSKLGILGWSYGGYAALQSAVIDPTLFKAVVAIAPVTDLPALKQDSRWWSYYRLEADRIGDGPQAVQGSPARRAASIKAPVLMYHGTMDRNVDIEQSRLMDKALRAAGRDSRLVVFENRDHQIDDSEMRAQMLRESDAFMRKAMGL
ncbi:alpha/beta hydrolase family protein [Rhizorhabdus sp. FW153]|uniref:alpha/beta hydrolase family protein n=1 Tax=Rhizorhabdus sp. FW153 TaxID=3400216 RepID=UPI003CF28E3C